MTGQPLKLYLDGYIWRELTRQLRAKGYDALHVVDAGRQGFADEAQLEFATQQGRAILTYHVKHFSPLARLWYEAGREYAGISLSVELPRGELMRQVIRLLEKVSADEMANRVRFLQDFK